MDFVLLARNASIREKCKTKQLFLVGGGWIEDELISDTPFDLEKDENNEDYSSCLPNPNFQP